MTIIYRIKFHVKQKRRQKSEARTEIGDRVIQRGAITKLNGNVGSEERRNG